MGCPRIISAGDGREPGIGWLRTGLHVFGLGTGLLVRPTERRAKWDLGGTRPLDPFHLPYRR